jgi:hypothetical protein
MTTENKPEPKMIRVVNKYTAKIDGIAVGAEGVVDANSGGVQHLLTQGLLVPADAAALAASMPSVEDIERMVQELDARGTRIAALEGEAFEREEWMAKLDEEIKVRDSRIAELEALLEKSTAPAEPTAPEEKPVEAAPKGKK